MLPKLYEEWNERVNVISRKDILNFEVNHLLHSLAVARLITFVPGTSVIDVGTGGGLPGIPLAIMFPDVKFTLIDSIAKKINVVNEIVTSTGITNITAVTVRSEDYSGRFEFVISRAVTETGRFINLTRHMISPRTVTALKNVYIFFKGGDIGTELVPFDPAVTVEPISQWFDEPWFETKKIVYLPW
jgi:16S rRNA (guanine527-N7)-methyltransferase